MKKLTSFLLFLTLFFSTSISSLAIEYGGIGGKPAYPQADNPRSESIFMHTLSAGDLQEEGVMVINNTDEEKIMKVYATDSAISTGGAFTCEQNSQKVDSAGTWISVGKQEVTVPAGRNEVVPFTITVPDGAEIGEHNACIVIEEVKPEQEAQAGVNISMRTAIRVIITIPGEIVKKIKVESFTKLKQENGDKFMQMKIRNNGNVSIDVGVNVLIKNIFGKTLQHFEGETPVLRGEASDLNIDLVKPFWGGIYTAKYMLTYDGANIAEKEVNIFLMPSFKGLIFELVIIVFIVMVVLFILHNQKSKTKVRATWTNYKVQSGDDIKDLAEQRGVSWKKIAKVNKLKAPYGLKKGQTIKLPPEK